MTIYQPGEHERLTPNSDYFPSRAPFNAETLMEDSATRWRIVPNNAENHAALMDVQNIEQIACFQGNIEKFIGTVKIPLGLICKQSASLWPGPASTPSASTNISCG